MSTIKTLGPVGYNPTGEYDSSTQYHRLDVVLYQGVSYVALQDVQGQLPTNTTYWDALGISGADMTNYYTKTQVDNALADKQNEITSDNKLSSDLVDDTNKTNKFVTAQEKTTWDNKSDFSGSYNDLTDKPTIPDKLSDLSDDSTHRLVTDTEKSTWNNKSDFSGSYNDLSNKPTIPVVPTNVSAFTNDAGYLTQHQDISGKEDKTNKVTSISSSSTDIQYPSAKCVYDIVGNINSTLDAINGESV